MKFIKVDLKTFNVALDKSKHAAFLHKYQNKELKTGKFYLSEDKQTGVGLTVDGEIINLFNNSKHRGRGKAALKFIMIQGGNHLNCFDGFLRWYYWKFGFQVVKKIPWDDQYAPNNWNYEVYGKPDVIYMSLLSTIHHIKEEG